jgi:hypothetical protein
MKTDEPEATADESRASRGASRAPAPPADPVTTAAPAAPEDARLDEAVALRRLATSLKAAYPSVDPSVVDQGVATARGSFRQAKVRTYVPILVERRVRALLSGLAAEEAAPDPTAVGDGRDGEAVRRELEALSPAGPADTRQAAARARLRVRPGRCR